MARDSEPRSAAWRARLCAGGYFALLLLSFALGLWLASATRLSSLTTSAPAPAASEVRPPRASSPGLGRRADSVPLERSLALYRARGSAFRALLDSHFDLDAGRMHAREAHIFEHVPASPEHYAPEHARTPCWWRNGTGQNAPGGLLLGARVPRGGRRLLLCLPSFFLLGPAKTGSTDLFKRIQRHPQSVPVRKKEPHWWASDRVWPGRYHGRHHYERYAHDVRRCRACMTSHALAMGKLVRSAGGGRVPRSALMLGDASTSTFWSLRGFGAQESEELSMSVRDETLLPQLLRHVPPRAKLVATLREPVARFMSGFNYFHRANFQPSARTTAALDDMCLEPARALRRCVAGEAPNGGGDPFACAWSSRFGYDPCRMTPGFYSLYLRAWREFWHIRSMALPTAAEGEGEGAGELLVVFLEDFDKSPRAHMKRVFDFLGMDSGGGDGSGGDDADASARRLSEADWQRILGGGHVNKMSGRKAAPSKALRGELEAAYAPFNEDLKALLRLERLPWEEQAAASGGRSR